MKKIYKTQNIPIAIYNINNISKSAKDKVYAQKEQDKLIEADKKKDNTGKYKNHKREKLFVPKKKLKDINDMYMNEKHITISLCKNYNIIYK